MLRISRLSRAQLTKRDLKTAKSGMVANFANTL
jgi:hypothetical protein